MGIQLKRIQDPPTAEDGYRMLVERAWPRGVKKEGAPVDEWALNLAPSEELVAWFKAGDHEWSEFRQRYFDELAAHEKVALLYSGRDEHVTAAAALYEYVRRRFSP